MVVADDAVAPCDWIERKRAWLDTEGKKPQEDMQWRRRKKSRRRNRKRRRRKRKRTGAFLLPFFSDFFVGAVAISLSDESSEYSLFLISDRRASESSWSMCRFR